MTDKELVILQDDNTYELLSADGTWAKLTYKGMRPVSDEEWDRHFPQEKEK